MQDRRVRIVSEDEVRRWYEEGWTYREMQEEHERKYGVRVALSTFSELRGRRGWERRAVWSDELVPWVVREEHRAHYYAALLRMEARRRAGKPLARSNENRLDLFLADLAESNAVVHYDPDTEEGFFLVPREASDTDIIRQPPASKRRQPRS